MHAGVSRTTASFVLNGRRDMRLSDDVWERVLESASELGYRPNLNARSLRTNQTQTIGLISDTIATTQFAGDLVRGATNAALEHDYLILIGETGGEPGVEERMIEAMLDRHVDGFVVAAMSTRSIAVPKLLQGRPTVLLNCFDPSENVLSVIPDEYEGGRSAVQALAERPLPKRVVVVGGVWSTPEHPEGRYAGQERMRGILDAAQELGVQIDEVIETTWSTEAGFVAVDELVSRGAPTAIICMNDRLALGAYQALSTHGLRVGQDVLIVSFDNQELASWLRPPLSSIAIPHYDMGFAAVRALLKATPATTIRVPMPPHVRASLGA